MSSAWTPADVSDSAPRFWDRVEKTAGCWIWKGAKTSSGYGLLFAGRRKKIRAHRLSFLLHGGVIAEGQFVCHHCDNPLCVNPAHLYAGSHADNMRDVRTRGRANRAGTPGETNPGAKLTVEQVREILRSRDTSKHELAAKYQCGERAIRNIWAGRTWARSLRERKANGLD